MSSRWHEETEEDLRLLAQEELILTSSELVSDALEKRAVTRSEFADMLGVKRSEVSQRLSGRRNLTVRSFADMMCVLGYEVQLDVRDLRADSPVWQTHVGSTYHSRPAGHYTVTGNQLTVCDDLAESS